MENSSMTRPLRLITYLSPGVPIGVYQMYQHYLEEVLGVDVYLMVESRASSPPPNKNPLTLDHADIAFMCSTGFLRLLDKAPSSVELLPAAPIHVHPKSELRPVYFSEVIINASRKDTYTEFYDLKGHRWAYNDELSLTGNVSVLAELKKMGASTTFFGDIVRSGSHHNSLQMLRDNRVDVAAIDSIVLEHYLAEHPERKEEFHTLASLGPFPVQPIVLNPRLPEPIKQKICEALLSMNQSAKWNQELQKWNMWGFKPIDSSLYQQEVLIRDTVKNTRLNPIYY